jgi:hypothetical protein
MPMAAAPGILAPSVGTPVRGYNTTKLQYVPLPRLCAPAHET